METAVLPTVTSLSLQFVISWSLLSSFWTDTSSSHTSTETPLSIPESPVHETQRAEQPWAVARTWSQLLDPSLKNKRVWVTHKQHPQTQCMWEMGWTAKISKADPTPPSQPTFKTCSRQSVTVQGHQTTGRTKSTAKNPSQGLGLPEIPPMEQLLGFQLSLGGCTEGSGTCREQDKAVLLNPGFFLKPDENSSPIPLHIYKQHHRNATLYALGIEKHMLRQH